MSDKKDFLDKILEEFDTSPEVSPEVKIPLSLSDVMKEIHEKSEKMRETVWLIKQAQKELEEINRDIRAWKIRYSILMKNYRDIKALDEDLLFLLTTLRAKEKEEEGKVTVALREAGSDLNIIKDSLKERQGLLSGTDLAGQVSFVKGISDLLKPLIDFRKESLEKLKKEVKAPETKEIKKEETKEVKQEGK
jgi:hypothetical protein